MNTLNIAIVKLTDDEVAHLRQMYNEGWATDIEKRLYECVSSMTYAAREDSVNNFLLTMGEYE